MRLFTYIAKHVDDKTKFAKEIGVSTVSVDRYLAGTRRPEWPVLHRIKAVTHGAVTPNDFLTPDDDDEEGQAA